MEETLSAMFQRTQGAPIEIAGRLVYPILRKKINAGRSNFLVRRVMSSSQSISGLRLKVVKGMLEVNNQQCSEIILWADTSPESVALSVISKAACELRAWNVWRVNDVVQAWVGNAGMVIGEEGSVTKLECSGGTETVDFSTLVFEIESVD